MFMLIMMIFLSTMFMFMKHPLSFGSILLIQTIMTSLITGMLNYNYWFSYILFLIMIGGMLILFIYMTSIAANEKFYFSSILFTIFIMMLMFMFLSNFIDSYYTSFYYSNYDHMLWMKNNLTTISMKKYLNIPTSNILILIIIHLLISLIAIVKIAKIQYGPLRQMF
uniref:NADH-ubiquinone oxidoreductase chain 6 n=1 Tax=Coleoptera sp. ACP-2013 TaxID=2485033 RepID=A0A3G3MEJ6_9COLE|nr:NADH dehydrogenase subunit 6 [Coleoptera sp. ACP-2013]